MPLYSLSVCYQSFEGLLDRGKALQKAMRKKSMSVVKDTSWNDEVLLVISHRLFFIKIAFCVMKRSHEGSYKKASPYFEVSLGKSDYCEDVLSKAASTLELNKGVKSWVIIRASGIIVW